MGFVEGSVTVDIRIVIAMLQWKQDCIIIDLEVREFNVIQRTRKLDLDYAITASEYLERCNYLGFEVLDFIGNMPKPEALRKAKNYYPPKPKA